MRKRYFAELSYKGTHYHGWQIQPNGISVQEVIEKALSTILRTKTAVVGCGRTDTGVHARQYFLHFDISTLFVDNMVYRLNKMLPKDIAIKRIFEVAPTAHARFDAHTRSYEYHFIFEKNPFYIDTALFYPFGKKLSVQKMQLAADLLLKYKEFSPFCKTKSDAKTMECDLKQAEWVQNENGLVFHISANRFLRGMVRLIVGMCLNVGLQNISIETIQNVMDMQKRLKKSYSVPPDGLFLTEIKYDYI